MTPTPALRALGLAAALSACAAEAAPVRSPTRPFIVVANQRSGVATLVEVTSGEVSHVELGANPHEVAISPDGRLAALTIPSDRLGSGRRVLIMDLATAQIDRPIDLGDYREPHGVAFVSDSVALVGTLGGTSAVYVNVRSGRVLRAVDGLPPNPYIIALTRTGRGYVSSPHSSKITELDVAGGHVMRTLDIPDDPAGIAVSQDGRELYAAVWPRGGGGGITIIDLGQGTVAARLPATQPRRVTVTADGRHVVVTDRDHLRVVDRATRQVRSITLGQGAGGSGVACSPDSSRCYVALSRLGEIVEVDLVAGRVSRRFPAARGVDGVAYVPR